MKIYCSAAHGDVIVNLDNLCVAMPGKTETGKPTIVLYTNHPAPIEVVFSSSDLRDQNLSIIKKMLEDREDKEGREQAK